MNHETCTEVLIERLVERLEREFRGVELGHCVRVEPLRREVSLVATQRLRERVDGERVEVWVLGSAVTDLELTTDRAIEARNRKRTSLCLFVPFEFQDAALSSLGNSFAVFDVTRYLRKLADELRGEIPEELQAAVRVVRSQIRKRDSLPAEWEVDYYAGIIGDPTPGRVGEDLWKLGLIPDLDGPNQPEFSSRLERNWECVNRLTRPRRAQASLDERIHSLGLQPGLVMERLREFLWGRRLQVDLRWLREILEEHRGVLTFEQWHFPEVEPTELEAVEAESFLDEQQCVKPFCKLKQEAPGTQLYAECGPGKVVVVKWRTTPSKPADVAKWRVELVPCTDEYNLEELGPVGLPSVEVGRNSRSAKVPLDLEVEGLEVRRVNAVVTPLDVHGFEIRHPENDEPFTATTLDFWLEATESRDGEAETRRKIATVRSLPDAYLRAAMETRAESRTVQPLAWEEKELWYFPVLVNERQVHRVGVSRFMRELEAKTLTEADTGGRYRVEVDGVDPLEIAAVESQPIHLAEGLAGAWEDFLKARRLFFRAVREGIGGLIEVADLDEELARRGRSYARTYLNLLRQCLHPEEGQAIPAPSPQSLLDLSQVDTLYIQYGSDMCSADAMVILPTHPLRVYWYLAYAELLRHFEEQLYAHPHKARKKLLALPNIERLSPQNFPAFVPVGLGQLYIYASNINFFTGVALRVDVSDPAAHVQETSRLLGYDAEAVGSGADAQRIAQEIGSYLDIHSYAETLRLNVVNPGGGTLVRDVVLTAIREADQSEGRKPLRSVDLITHVDRDTLQRPAPGLDELVSLGYQNTIPQGWSYLHPMLQVARRPLRDIESLPGHDTHLALCLDQFQPQIVPGDLGTDEESASVYGLVARFRSCFEASGYGAVWSRKVAYAQPSQIERHPIKPSYTVELLAMHQTYLELAGRLLDPHCAAPCLPCLRLEVGPESNRLLTVLHDRADWVITVDRHFGVEYYDDPSHPETARNAERYLLDYAPEFMEGMGHRMIVTTAWREEVSDVLARGLEEMALSSDAGSCRLILNALKAVSGRLALRLVRDTPQEKEAISMAILVEYLRRRGDLAEAFLVPVDVHPELLDPSGTVRENGALARCDLLLVRLGRELRLTFIEAKYRSGELGIGAEGALFDRIADQTQRTEDAFREAFGCGDSGTVPVDQAIRRSHLTNVLKFYLERAKRYGFLRDEAYHRIKAAIQKIEVEFPRLVVRRVGYVICPSSPPRSKIVHQGTTIHFISGVDIRQEVGIDTTAFDLSFPEPQEELEPSGIDHREVTVNTGSLSLPLPPKGGEPRGPEIIRVVLGEAIGNGQTCNWNPSTQGSPHLFIVGIPGQGKSVTARRIIQASVNQGLATLALDFHGELAAKAEEMLEAGRYRIVDAAAGLPFSPFEAVGDRTRAVQHWQANAFSLAEIVGWVCDLGDIQRDLIYEAIRNCYQASFVEVDEPSLPTPEEVFAEIQRLEQTRKIRNVVARVRPLFDVDFDLFRPVQGQTLYDMISGLSVIDLHKLGQETLQLAAGAFLLRKIYKDMLQWPAAERLRLLLVLDEAHRLAKDLTLPKIMKEGRKFGVVVVGVSQGLADFHPDVLNNAGTKVVFRMNFPESRRVASLVRGNSPEQPISRKIEGLTVGRAIVSTPEWPHPTECVMFPV